MKEQKIYQRIIWLSVLASIAIVIVMMSSMLKSIPLSNNSFGGFNKVGRLTDLVITKMM